MYLVCMYTPGVLTEAVDEVLTPWMRERFGFDAGLVTVGMVACIVGALLLAALMAAQQLHQAARRPILKNGRTPPDLPLRGHHTWHMFLSHSPHTA